MTYIMLLRILKISLFYSEFLNSKLNFIANYTRRRTELDQAELICLLLFLSAVSWCQIFSDQSCWKLYFDTVSVLDRLLLDVVYYLANFRWFSAAVTTKKILALPGIAPVSTRAINFACQDFIMYVKMNANSESCMFLLVICLLNLCYKSLVVKLRF
eukprot:TRINITY_DN2814_c0_g1_i15.p2 TRINITY_DN2814_c0_g1~~TRINITY_DN2814_c0_g1_i15.p2  ORF type:complete len:157 (-),score=0.66 TRINITY_DN2814_c0_g1_i15:353-823(-)